MFQGWWLFFVHCCCNFLSHPRSNTTMRCEREQVGLRSKFGIRGLCSATNWCSDGIAESTRGRAAVGARRSGGEGLAAGFSGRGALLDWFVQSREKGHQERSVRLFRTLRIGSHCPLADSFCFHRFLLA